MKDIYKNYDAVQLAAEEAFIRWARGQAAADDAAWQAWLDRHPEKRPVVEEARVLVKALTFEVAAPQVDTKALWGRIQAGSRQPAEVKPLGRRRFLWGVAGAVAAAIALLVFAIFGIDRPRLIQTQVQEQLSYVLPDQSRVRLNADSRLRYEAGGRRVELQGEAFFEVTSGTDFRVTTPLGQVRVLGTQFNVFSRRDRFEVQCTEGRVQVTTETDVQGVILTPGMACRLNPAGQLQTTLLSGPEAGVGWLQDIYRFREQPLRDVFAEMERQFGVTITADDDISSRIHTGFFEGGDLRKALENVCWTRQLAFSIEGKQVRITEADTE